MGPLLYVRNRRTYATRTGGHSSALFHVSNIFQSCKDLNNIDIDLV